MKGTRLFTIFLLVIALLCSFFVIAGCSDEDDNDSATSTTTPSTLTKLITPTVVLNGATATWSADAHADMFEISVDGNLSHVGNSVTSKQLADGQTFKIRAIGDGVNYISSDWSNSVTYTESNEPGSNYYTVVWKNGDAVLEIDTNVVEGTIPDYNGSIPVKDNHTFIGWTPSIVAVNSNVTYQAQFEENVQNITFTVIFKDFDGTVLKTESVQRGANATPPANPARDGYIFEAWSGTYTNVLDNQTVIATYTKNTPTVTYTVTFYDYDRSTVLGTSTVEEGTAATPPSNPSKSGATFIGWNGNYTNVSQDEAVFAVYSDIKNVFFVGSATGSVGDNVTLIVSVDGVVKTCGFDITLYYDNAILELVSYDSDLDLDVVVNAEYLDNGVILNFSAATEKTKSREIISLTFKIKDTTKDATSVMVEMTSIKEMDETTIVDSSCEIVAGVVTIR